jgi:broad specificity phosphatase PhoE
VTTRVPRLHLVRHGRPRVDRARPPHTWTLDPAGLPDIDALRASGTLPEAARWFSSPEPKALETARRLTDSEVRVVPDLREHERHSTHWFADPAEFRATVRRAFAYPERSARAGWEPLAATRDRLLPAVRRILTDHPGEDVVLAGHGTAWTVVAAALAGRSPDLDAWARLRMPDVWVVEPSSA